MAVAVRPPDPQTAPAPGSRRALRAAEKRRTRSRRPALSSLSRRHALLGAAAVGAALLAGVGVVVGADRAVDSSRLQRVAFAPTGTSAWFDVGLGQTAGADQYAQAHVTGLVDGDHQAAFQLRYATPADRLRVSVSGTGWRVDSSGRSVGAGTFPHAPSGVFRAEVAGQTVRVLWNDHLVATSTVPHPAGGRRVVASVWQSSPTVRMTSLQAAALQPDERTHAADGATTGTRTRAAATPTPSGTPTSSASSSSGAQAGTHASGRVGWLSGASGDSMASGGFDRWRGTAAGIAGTWDDSAAGQAELYSICGGQYKSWNRALDLAIGGIYKNQGDSWSAAASGSYNARWTKVLTTMKSCWGSRDPGKLFVRFAHEMNLANDWSVSAGEEADFVKAFTQFSTLRYQIFPGIKLVYCPNDGSSNGLGDVRTMFPGKDAQGRRVADVYAVDSYNAWPHATTAASFQEKINATTDGGAPLGIEKHRQLAQRLGVPFAIGEWSNNGDPGDGGGGGESPEYVRDFFAWARSHAGDVDNPRPGQLLYEVQFNLWNQYELWPSTIQPQTASAYTALPWGRV